jgi:hypothetical protein
VSDSSSTDTPQAGTNEPQESQTPLPVPIEVESVWRECEARLKILRSDIEKLRTNSASSGKTINPHDDAKMQQVMEILSSLAKDPFALIERGIEDAQRAANTERKSNPPQPDAAPVHPDNSKPATPDNTNSITVPAAPKPNTAADFQTQQIQNDAQAVMTAAVAPIPVGPAQNAPESDFGFSPFNGAATSDSIVSAQASGERLRAALEQNTQVTASLFDGMLALIDGQNRKLGEVDRKISDLSGQLNSLKNP